MLNYDIKYENSPNLKSKLEQYRPKAMNFAQGLEQPVFFLQSWICEKIEPNVMVEKIFYHQNVKGKANSNFILNLPDHYGLVFLKYVLMEEKMRQIEAHNRAIELRNQRRAEEEAAKASVVPHSKNRIVWGEQQFSHSKKLKRLELLPNSVNLLSPDSKMTNKNGSVERLPQLLAKSSSKEQLHSLPQGKVPALDNLLIKNKERIMYAPKVTKDIKKAKIQFKLKQPIEVFEELKIDNKHISGYTVMYSPTMLNRSIVENYKSTPALFSPTLSVPSKSGSRQRGMKSSLKDPIMSLQSLLASNAS